MLPAAFHPVTTALLGVVVFAVIHLLAPVTLIGEVPFEAYAYLIGCYLLFCLGSATFCLLPRKVLSVRNRFDLLAVSKLYKIYFWLSVFFASVGIIARIFDKFYFRGVDFYSTVFSNREALVESPPTLLGIVGGILFPIGFVSLFLMLRNNYPKSRLVRGYIWSMTAFPSLEALFFGGRSVLLLSFCILAIILVAIGKVKLKMAHLLKIGLISSCLMLISGSVFLQRLEEMGVDITYSVHNSAYAEFVRPLSEYEALMNRGAYVERLAKISWLNFTQYYIHGLYEFGYYWSNKPEKNVFGALEFYPIYRIIAPLFSFPPLNEQMSEIAPRSGVFTTFFGPAYMDFGYWSLVFLYLLGLLSTALFYRIRKRLDELIVVYAVLWVVTFFMPVVNFIQSAQGLYFVMSTLIFYCMQKSILMIVGAISYKNKDLVTDK